MWMVPVNWKCEAQIVEPKTWFFVLKNLSLSRSCCHSGIALKLKWVLIKVALPPLSYHLIRDGCPQTPAFYPNQATFHCCYRHTIISQVFRLLMYNRHFCISPEEELLITKTSCVDQKMSSWGSCYALGSWLLSQAGGISKLSLKRYHSQACSPLFPRLKSESYGPCSFP